jgi:hypothetical protein
MPVPIPRWQQFIGVGKESTWNTPVTAATFYPMNVAVKHRSRYEPIEDDGIRGTAARLQGWYQGVGWTEIAWPGLNFYPDDSGVFLMGLLGTDTVTGSNPFTHTVTLNNSAFPPSYTGVRFTGLVATAEQIGGVYWEELVFKFSAATAHGGGRLTIDVKGKGSIQGTVTKPSNTYSTQQIVLPWQGALTLAGGASAKLLNGTITLKRTVDLIFGISNTQAPTQASMDQIDVAGKVEMQSSDQTELNYYLSNTQPAFSIIFTSGANSLTLQMSKSAWRDPTELDTGTPYMRTLADFGAVANATDAGTGNAPLKAVVVNPRATSY